MLGAGELSLSILAVGRSQYTKYPMPVAMVQSLSRTVTWHRFCGLVHQGSVRAYYGSLANGNTGGWPRKVR